MSPRSTLGNMPGTIASDDGGLGFVGDLVQLFTWICVGLAILIAIILLLHWNGRRRSAESATVDDNW